MGIPSSKPCSNEALNLCRDRTQYIKQVIDSRYALSAAHLAYIQSLRSTGTALRRFVEAEMSTEQSISTSEPDRTLSRSSYASSSPTQTTHHLDSPPRLVDMSYMRALGNSSVAVTVNPSLVHFVKEEEVTSSPWDFFDPYDKGKSSEIVPLVEVDFGTSCRMEGEKKVGVDKSLESLIGIASCELRRSDMGKFEMEDEEVIAEREDASEFITHRAKDFLSSMKDIEHRFLRAADSGNEVSRLLETSKIRLGITSEIIGVTGKSSSCRFLSTFQDVCCNTEAIFKQESGTPLAKVITWNRSLSSLSSSSSKSRLATAPKDCEIESDFEFNEEFCMISGSHSSTLDRLYAWEIKLYDEVKASESLRRAYDQKCGQLRHQFARNMNPQAIDKTRAVVKNLHSQIMVSIHAVDSISKRIEKMRDEELQPQLMELLKGLIKMWKAMLECHHKQFITISLAYHVISSKPTQSESFDQALSHLQIEINCFTSTTANLVKSHKSYIESLNSWIHKCILQPQEPPKGKRRKATFPPRSSFSLPPIFVLCQHWLKGITSLPFEELNRSIKDVASILHESVNQQREERTDDDAVDENEAAKKFCRNWNLDALKISLIRVFDQLAKFSEASLKVFEDVRKVNETACTEYFTN